MRYLLDTNIVSDLVRNPQGKVARHVRAVGEKHVCTSIIVAAELRYAANKKRADKKGSPRLSSQLDVVLGVLEILPFETPADTSYGLLRTRLEKAGTPIGANDLLIAAQALTLGYVIVTDNEREFSRVKRLRLQNWLRSTE
jgi:tRNA(fMet)-specific endonuclease VapC